MCILIGLGKATLHRDLFFSQKKKELKKQGSKVCSSPLSGGAARSIQVDAGGLLVECHLCASAPGCTQRVHLGLPSSSLLRERSHARHQRCVELILSVLAFFEDLLVKCKDNQDTPWAVRGGRLCVASIIELGCACSFTLGVVSAGKEGSRSLLASERFQLTILMLRACNLPRLLNLGMLLDA